MDHDFKPLPSYADPRGALRRALPALRSANDVPVIDAAENHMRVSVGGSWQDFDRDVTPYLTEPTNQIALRDYRGLVLCGPSQSGKTQMLQSVCAHAIMCDPGRVAIFQMTENKAKEFEADKIAPMIRNSPDLRGRLAKGRGSDTIFQKLFLGGMRLTMDWPTPTTLASSSIRWALGTDYDHWPASIGGEGDAWTMLRARVRSYQSRGMAVVESSPTAMVTDTQWRPKTVHDCPPVKTGVLSLYPGGTRGRYYWPCPTCGDEFEPSHDLLRWPDGVDPIAAGQAAEMICPHCGGIIGHDQKRALNRAGRWLHESSDGTRAVPLGDPDIRQAEYLSYWYSGVIAAFSSWAELVSGLVDAERHFKETDDEERIITALNTGFAVPHVPRVLVDDDNALTADDLRDQAAAIDTPKGSAPDWVRFITVSVDTQGNRFEVQATGWGDGGRHQIIDRFELHTPPEGAPDAGDRGLKPFDYAEDWQVLDHLSERAWPVVGRGYALRAVAIVVDMQGGKATVGDGSATENAYAFYRARRAAGEGQIWFLSRGRGGRHRDRVWLEAPERKSGTARKGRRVASDIKILNMSTDRLKNAVHTSLKITEGKHVCHMPAWMGAAHLAEAVSERKDGENWVPRAGQKRNETFDLLVQARAIFIHLKGEKLNPASPPDWARGDAGNLRAVVLASPEDGATRSERPADPVNPVAETVAQPTPPPARASDAAPAGIMRARASAGVAGRVRQISYLRR